jgi:hypothetical protein
MNHHEKHEKIEELIAAGAIGGLDAADLAELDRLREAHGPDCPECGRLEDEYREVSGRLAFSAGPGEVPAGMEDRVVAAAAARGRGVSFRARQLVAAAAAAVLLVAGGVGGYLLAPRSSAPSISSAAAYYLTQRGVRVTSLEGPGPGAMTLAYRPGASVSYLIGSGLPAAPSDRVYELWLFHGRTPRPAGTFRPTGRVTVVRVGFDASSADLAAITIERAPGAKKPTTQPIFQGSLRSL